MRLPCIRTLPYLYRCAARRQLTTAMMGRTYADAVSALNTLQSNFSIVNAIRKSGMSLHKNAIPEMIDWCRRIGYEPSDFNRLNIIHIAGTKGKGSTSAFISSILVQYTHPSPHQPDPPLSKIGLYTSPHLRFVRERIQINNEPLSEEAFAKYFFEIWDRLEEAARSKGEPTDTSAKPSYFRFLTLMAFHTYLSEGVNTSIVECGIGGEYDSTNILVRPSVTGITTLGIDHTAMLGNTIEEIAWHKGGIMKKDVPCYTAPQPPSALDVLHKRSEEIFCPLSVVNRHPGLSDIKLGLAADFQQTNASLAIAIAWKHLFLSTHDNTHPLPSPFIRGLENVRWPGRCEIRREKQIAWHIDSGHTLESIEVAGTWFASHIAPTTNNSNSDTPPAAGKPTRILLFNQQTRDANALAKALHNTLSNALDFSQPFTHAVFCTNTTFRDAGYRPDLVSMNTSKEAVDALEVQRGLAEAWAGMDAEAVVEVKTSIEEAVGWCRGVAKDAGGEVKVLVTGSVHLVGGFLEVLETGGVGGDDTSEVGSQMERLGIDGKVPKGAA